MSRREVLGRIVRRSARGRRSLIRHGYGDVCDGDSRRRRRLPIQGVLGDLLALLLCAVPLPSAILSPLLLLPLNRGYVLLKRHISSLPFPSVPNLTLNQSNPSAFLPANLSSPKFLLQLLQDRNQIITNRQVLKNQPNSRETTGLYKCDPTAQKKYRAGWA